VTTAWSTDAPELTEGMCRAVTEAFGARTPIVIGYIGSDGFPRRSRGAAVQAEGGSQLVLWVGDDEEAVLSAIATDPRLSVFVEDRSARAGDRVSGTARAAKPVPEDGEGPRGSIIVDLVQVEMTEPGPDTLPQRPAEALVATTPGVSILDVAGLSIYYGTTRAVNNLSLQVRRGEIFGLLGPNGAGKTSTLSAIEGLLRPRSGTIALDEVDVLRHPLEARASMGVQLQATSFQASLTIKEIVRLFGGLYGVAMSDADIAATLGAVGLEADMGKQFKQLSGGQQQRLSLQIAVLHEPTLLLLDEPTGGLDPQARRQLWGRIEHLRQNGGSILLTTHSMEEAQAVCDRVAIMDHGEILTCGSPQELIALHRNDPNVLAVAHGEVTLDDVFVGLTGTAIRE
jgi:ABC-2 type transport system ATP-binding protein